MLALADAPARPPPESLALVHGDRRLKIQGAPARDDAGNARKATLKRGPK